MGNRKEALRFQDLKNIDKFRLGAVVSWEY